MAMIWIAIGALLVAYVFLALKVRRLRRTFQAGTLRELVFVNSLPKDLINEWALHVEAGSDASIFANIYLELLRDPDNAEIRRACAVFLTYMEPRNWEQVFAVLRPSLDTKTIRIFERPVAADFYESFKAMVVQQIQDYWEQFMQEHRKENDDLDGAVA